MWPQRFDEGNEFQAVVEFAPYQKIPLEKKKADSRNGTIEKGVFNLWCDHDRRASN